MEGNEKNKKNYLVFILTALVLVILYNAFVIPSVKKSGIKEADYSFFLEQIDKGSVTGAEIGESSIFFEIKDKNGKKQRYSTVRLDDGQLVERLYNNGTIEFTGSIKKTNPSAEFFLSWLMPLILIIVIFTIFAKRVGKRTGIPGNITSLGKSNAKIYVKAQTRKTFEDVAGQDEAKETLAEIVDFLHDPEKYSGIGAVLPKGALLVGPPGTGKTLLAQAVAGEADVPFFSISGSEFVEMFVGMGAAKVRDLFRQANEKAPCIVFIDEIDAIGKKRDGQTGGSDEREQTLNQLLTEMDGFDGKKGVVILAATNRPDSLDPALLRPGRFDRRIPAELPDMAGREAILKVHARKIKTDASIDFSVIARATSGASGAELANIVNEAALRAVRSGRRSVTQTDLEESVEIVIAGYERKNAVISQKERKIVAYHEIGHAIVAAVQKDSAPVHKITIIPRTSGALGYTMQIDEGEKFLMTKEEALAKITVLTGGRAAEELIFGTCTSGASNDIEKATKLARSMITRFGMSENFGMVALETVNDRYLGDDTSLVCSQKTAYMIDNEVKKIIKICHEKAAEILSGKIEKLRELSEFLLERETISGDKFIEILES